MTAGMCSVGFSTPHCHDFSGDSAMGIATVSPQELFKHAGTSPGNVHVPLFFFVSLFNHALKLNTGFITSIISAESLMTSMISSIGLYAIGDSSIVS